MAYHTLKHQALSCLSISVLALILLLKQLKPHCQLSQYHLPKELLPTFYFFYSYFFCPLFKNPGQTSLLSRCLPSTSQRWLCMLSGYLSTWNMLVFHSCHTVGDLRAFNITALRDHEILERKSSYLTHFCLSLGELPCQEVHPPGGAPQFIDYASNASGVVQHGCSEHRVEILGGYLLDEGMEEWLDT